MWKYEITTVDGHHSLKHINLKDIKFTIKCIKLSNKFNGQSLIKPKSSLLVQHVLFECYNLNNISSITISTFRR